MFVPVSYSVRSLWVRRTTTVATAFGVGLVVFVLASALMLGQGVRRTLVARGSEGRAMVLRKGADTEMASGLESGPLGRVLSAAPGVKRGPDGQPLVTEDIVIVVSLEQTGAPGLVSNILVRGVQPRALAVRPEVHVIAGKAATPGTDEVIIGRRLRGKFNGLDLGSSFDLKKNRPVHVVGIFESSDSSFESEVWADIETVRTSFGRGNMSSSGTVVLASPSAYDGFGTFVESDRQLGLQAFRESDYYEKQSDGTSTFITVLGSIITFFFSVGAMIGATITMYGAVAQRSKEIGTLRALGFSRSAVLLSFVFESGVLALLGGTLGGLASLSMTAVHFSMMNFATWQEISFSFQPSWPIILGAIAIGGIMGLLGGFAPALKAARLSPIEAMRA